MKSTPYLRPSVSSAVKFHSLLESLPHTRRDRKAGKNAPRTLDLDLITTDGAPGNWTWETPEDLRVLGAELSLELPHPRAFSRPFVLEPWRALSEPGACGGVIPKKQGL